MISYSKQSISKKDTLLVAKALQKNLITTGDMVPKFEKKISSFVNSNYSVAVNSATSALHISCMALNLKKNNFLWTSCNTFVASINCGIYCGAKVDLIDIDPQDYNLSIDFLKKKLQKAKIQRKLPKIIIPVHFAGHSCEMKEIKNLSKFYNFKIIEDASHALGGFYKNEKIGNCKYSDITVFSFHPTKIITTIEGGIACTNNKKIYEKLKIFRTHGIDKKKYYYKKKYFLNYQQIDLGYNYRMNDVQATLGINQLKRINLFLKKRKEISKIYYKKLVHRFIQLPIKTKGIRSSFHLFVIRIKHLNSKINRDILYKTLLKKKIGVNIHYIPIHFHKFYQKIFNKKKFPESEKYYEEALSLPIHPDLSKKDVNKIIYQIKKIIK
jgi:UDP-4-amino-4,6-dideoxy-N-acetyl-beta-L-altrosamine transaminase